jgi:hypothetical protein
MRDITVFNEITAKDLDILVRTREQKQREVFILVLERIYSRIRRCAFVSMSDCRFDFPEVVYGHPMFDIDRCIKFATRHLVMNGFNVSRTLGSQRSIDIMWGASAIAAAANAQKMIAPPQQQEKHRPLPVSSSSLSYSSSVPNNRNNRNNHVHFPMDTRPHGDGDDNGGDNGDMLVSISRRRGNRSPSPHRSIDTLVTRNIIPSSR